MLQPGRATICASVFALGAVGLFLWKRWSRHYVKVARISKLFFYPVKSLKGIEVTEGKCTKKGFEVNGLLDRSFMLVNGEGVLVSQRDVPSLVLLTPSIEVKTLVITSPKGETLKVVIKDSPSPQDKIISCNVFTDSVDGVDCGDEAAAWFQAYMGLPDVRLVRYFPGMRDRKYTKKEPFYAKAKKQHPVGFQDLSALHVFSEASVIDLNSRLTENKITLMNFRPNIYVDECKAFAEDAWKYIKFESGAEAWQFLLTTRCLLTTNNPETGELSKKDPLVTLRKFRITKDPELKKIIGSIPCFGVNFAVLQNGTVRIGEDVFAHVGSQPEMAEKE